MKHSNPHVEQLARLCDRAELRIPERTLCTLVGYLEAVLEANKKTNLTRIADLPSGVRLHLVDSLCALPEVLAAPQGSLCDIGTGGGFPGLPLAVASGRECTLLDSVRKKSEIVQQIVIESDLADKVHTSSDRAEQHARAHPGQYAVVTARAVAPLASLVELSAPLLVMGGHLVALKGALTEEELNAGVAAAKVTGLQLVSNRAYDLPGGDERRCVIVFKKVKDSRVALPRREGLAQHAPLG